MYTLGYSFRPWEQAEVDRRRSVDPRVRAVETASDHDVERHIRFGHRVVRSQWSSADARWTVEAEREDTGERVRLTCGFLLHVQRLLPLRRGLHARRSPASRASRGEIVHPQHWPEDLDYAGKRVVVIGSGATAVTLVPSLAEDAAHVTMLQRSPSYIVSLPADRPLRTTRAPAAPAQSRLRGRALEERADDDALLPAQPPPPGAGQALRATRARAPAAARLRHRHALLAVLQPVGPARVPGARRRHVRRDLATAARRSSPITSSASPSTACGCAPGPSCTPI